MMGTMDEIRAQLTRIEGSTKRTEQAVFGDGDLGLTGLVGDMAEVKKWRSGLILRTTGIIGIFTGAVLGTKAIITFLVDHVLKAI